MGRSGKRSRELRCKGGATGAVFCHAAGLFDLEKADNDLVRIALADAYEQTLDEPLKVGCSSFEFRLSAEIYELWIDGLPREQLLHDVGRRRSNSAVLHIDEIAFIRLDRIARVEFCEAVRLDRLPVGAAGRHGSVQHRTFDRAGLDWH